MTTDEDLMADETTGPRIPGQPAANPWARRGRVALQTSHGLTAPLVRLPLERVACEIGQAAGNDGTTGESEPGIPIPAPVLQARPPHRLPEDVVCRSPIAGLVIVVSAAAGQAVRKHEAVLVIEAMKMQNNVCAQVDGVVKTVHVAPGDAVKAGQVLFELA
jgi:biotin carboxyl carrier protein